MTPCPTQDEDLERLLDKEESGNIKVIEHSINDDKLTVRNCLKSIEIIHKKEYWYSHHIKLGRAE